MEINNNSRQVKGLSFKGYQHKKTETGSPAYEFNCVYDSSKFDCEIQFFKVGMDNKRNYFIERGCDGKMEPFCKLDVPKNGVMVDPSYDLDLADEQPFAYRFVLKDKSGKIVGWPKEDNAEIDGCTIVNRKGTSVTKQGPMYLASVDTLAPGYVFEGFNSENTGKLRKPTAEEKQEIADKIRSSNRTFSNTMGGTLAGLQAKIPEIREAGNKRIITLPLKGGDTVSSHKYWNQNNMLLAGGIGNLNDYSSVQREAFRYGMNMVDDGTFTSEGLQGIHFQRAIKWMDSENKPDEYYYFRMSGLQDGSLGLGVVPENYENLNNKIINCPFNFEQGKDGQIKISKNEQYDSSQPTKFQIFDDTLVSDEQRNDKTKEIKSYAKTVANDNKLAMNTHEDTPEPYVFEVSPYELKKNIESLNEVNRMRGKSEQIKMNSPRGTMFIGSLSGISIEPKEEGGFVCWDANTDMVKMNYFTSKYDDELLSAEKDPAKKAIEMDRIRRGNAQVQDMAVSAGKYWTRRVRNIHNEYVAKTIGKISSNPAKAENRISGILDTQNPKNPKLPEDVRLSREVIANVLGDDYELRPKYEDYDDLLNSSLMELQLDSIEFAPDTQAALSSPYLMKRSYDSDHIGESRFDAMNDPSYKVPKEYAKTYNKMNDVFKENIRDFADKVLQKVNDNSDEKLFDKDGVTEYGQYVIPLVAEDIAKYAVVKSLMPQTKAKHLSNGEIAYDYDTMLDKGSLRNIGINGDSQKDEANQIVNKIRNGIADLRNSDINFVATSINKRIQNTNANSFKLAEVMVDRSGLGLDWRLDAAKDIADMDSVRNGVQTFDKGWDNMTKFWGDFVGAVKKENPNSYIVAEITDVDELIKAGRPDDGQIIYDNGNKAISALIDMAGITSEANYSYFFNGISNLFSRDFASGNDNVGNSNSGRMNKLEENLNRFAAKPIDYKRNSYTFAGNHDKTRIIHALSMDMSMFHATLSNTADKTHRTRAYMILNNIMNESELKPEDYSKIDDKNYFNNVSAKAVANGDLLRGSIGKANEEMKNAEKAEVSKKHISEEEKQREYGEIDKKYSAIYTALSDSIADVVKGNYYKTEDDIHSITTPDSSKKIGEKEGFGSKPIPDAFDIVYDQAIEKHGLADKLDKDHVNAYRNLVDSKATEVGRAKLKIIMKFLNAISGNPTLYSGDELGMTGYEDKCKNTFLQNRNPLDWSVVEDGPNKRQDIVDYKKSLEDISSLRKDDDMHKLEALNNGTMYKLDALTGKKSGKNETMKVSAILSQASNGVMSISVLNPNDITTANDVDVQYIKPANIDLDSIYLKTAKEKLTLNAGTEFKNVDPDDKSVYRVCTNNKGDYYIKRIVNDKEEGIALNETTAKDGVMMLYHIPDDIATERSQKTAAKNRARQYYNYQYNSQNDDAYRDVGKPQAEQGRNIDITSKE